MPETGLSSGRLRLAARSATLTQCDNHIQPSITCSAEGETASHRFAALTGQELQMGPLGPPGDLGGSDIKICGPRMATARARSSLRKNAQSGLETMDRCLRWRNPVSTTVCERQKQ